MEQKQLQQQAPVGKSLKVWRVVSVALLVLAIAYVVLPQDFDRMGWMGYIDDFFVFMAAFVFLQGSFQRPERRFLRRQLFMIAAVFIILAMLWICVLAWLAAR